MAASKKTMREVIVSPGPEAKLIDSPIPTPEAGEILIKVVVSGSNPKDWKVPEWTNKTHNSGDDIGGIVASVGPGVYEFKQGDRVAAFHVMVAPGGSYAEYAIAPATTTFLLPPQTSFEEGAAIPLAALTAALCLYGRLHLPEPWVGGEREATPLLIYGASTAVGTYALQLALRSGIHPIIAVGGRARAHIEQFLDTSKGDVFVDYRGGVESMIKEINAAIPSGKKLEYAADCISEGVSVEVVTGVLAKPEGKFTVVLPVDDAKVPEGITKLYTNVGDVHKDSYAELGYVYSRYFSRGLHEGWFRGQPHEVRSVGLEGVGQALKDLKEGKASAVKYVFRIADTPGIDEGSQV